ncbi:MAG: YdcF family protein [Chitinophagaceae bacterium]|nr:YdcF family protein [Chitinophagaceae bacterium]
MLKKKRYIILLVIVATAAVIYFCNKKINDAAEGKLYSDISAIPYTKTGLLLGTGKFLTNGSINPYYRFRIEAARDLLRSGKIKFLIISGDNSRKDYDEPSLMRSDLIDAGMDSTVIFLDHAGFRTFDSVIRAREIFDQQALTIISQPFHNQRAIFIAAKENIEAIGFNAADVSRSTGLKVQFREKLARVKVFIDYLLGQKPRFLGPKVVIPE